MKIGANQLLGLNSRNRKRYHCKREGDKRTLHELSLFFKSGQIPQTANGKARTMPGTALFKDAEHRADGG
jgi:hypothetical protein